MTEPKGEDRANVKLDIRSVSKLYRSVVAVDDVSLQISDGEFLTLLGPSGSRTFRCSRTSPSRCACAASPRRG